MAFTAYLGAMAAAANYGRVNRQLLAGAARRVFEKAAGARLDLVYDVSHNLAKLERHQVGGHERPVNLALVHQPAQRRPVGVALADQHEAR
jgi:RNA-splicing ligase RtcB